MLFVLQWLGGHRVLICGVMSLIGGGIVYDSVEEDEYVETMNKLASNLRCLEQAEGEYPVSNDAVTRWLTSPQCPQNTTPNRTPLRTDKRIHPTSFDRQ